MTSHDAAMVALADRLEKVYLTTPTDAWLAVAREAQRWAADREYERSMRRAIRGT